MHSRNMTVLWSQSLEKKENRPKSSQIHIPNFWSLHMVIHIRSLPIRAMLRASTSMNVVGSYKRGVPLTRVLAMRCRVCWSSPGSPWVMLISNFATVVRWVFHGVVVGFRGEVLNTGMSEETPWVASAGKMTSPSWRVAAPDDTTCASKKQAGPQNRKLGKLGFNDLTLQKGLGIGHKA